MSVHIGTQKGDIAETILLPGDPLRAEWIAETFLEEPGLKVPILRQPPPISLFL